jgi:hypothetical protein
MRCGRFRNGVAPNETNSLQLKTKIGIALVALGFGVHGAWNWWTKTRNLVPVNVPVMLAAGQKIPSEFKLNFDGLYLIEIDAEKTIPLDTLQCLMGVDANPTRCKGTPSAIAATWILSSNGQEIRRGNSMEPHSARAQTDGIARVIGEFQGKAGREYQLQVEFTSDGESLVAAHPRLKVGVASIAYTDLQSASVLVSSMVFICELFGVVLLVVAYYVKRRTGNM